MVLSTNATLIKPFISILLTGLFKVFYKYHLGQSLSYLQEQMPFSRWAAKIQTLAWLLLSSQRKFEISSL